MANVLKIGVDNPEELLNAGAYGAGALIQIQSGTASAGPFADISGTGSTPTIPIVSGTYAYTGYDPTGGSTTWYQTRYKNATGTLTSDWTTAFQVGKVTYCTLYDVKQDLDKAPTDATSDEILLDYIIEITDYIRGYCGREFATESGVFTFDGYATSYGGKCLPIPGGVQSISLLEAAASTGASFTTIASTSYVLRPSAQDRTPGWSATEVWLIESASPFLPGYDNIRLTGVLGHGVPARIEGIARRTVVRAYASRQAGGNDLVGTDEGGTRIVSQFLSKRDREMLNSFAPVLVG